MVCRCGADSKYKCPACGAPYCSVACYKEHKQNCTPVEKNQAVEGEKINKNVPLAEDPEIERMLRYSSLRQHLKLVASILTDSSVSREQTAEGRQLVALKKLRELRKGGREENELVEEFCAYVAEHSSNLSH